MWMQCTYCIFGCVDCRVCHNSTVHHLCSYYGQAALCDRAGQYIFVLWFLLLPSFFLTYTQPSEIGCLPYFHTLCSLSAYLECRSEMCCTRLAENTGRKKSPKSRNTVAQLYRAVSLQLRHVSTIGKKIVKQQYLLHMWGQYAEPRPTNGWDQFGSLGHPANFNGFRVLASLLHRCRSPETNQTLHNVWPSPGLVHYLYIFGSCPLMEFIVRCKIHFAIKSCVLLYFQHYCTVLEQLAWARLCGVE